MDLYIIDISTKLNLFKLKKWRCYNFSDFATSRGHEIAPLAIGRSSLRAYFL